MSAFRAQIFDQPGGVHRGRRLQFGVLAGTERGGNSMNQADQRDAENGDRHDDFDQRETRAMTVSIHSRSKSRIFTRDVMGLMRSASRKPCRSRNSNSAASAVPSE